MAQAKRPTTGKGGSKGSGAEARGSARRPRPGAASKYATPRNRRADGLATRARVLEAAAEVFARDGFEGTSLRGIAETAGIDIATLKYHFGDKAALFSEVYRDGYEHFQQALGPQLLRVPLARNSEELEKEVKTLLEKAYDYLEAHERFVRLWLFRLLERPSSVELGAEEAARSNVMALLQAAVGILHERKLVRDIDVPILVLLVVTGLPSMMLGAKSRPGMLGEPTLPPRERFVGFFVELLKRQLLPGPGGE